eukprot:gnl/Ergobibamus_cyprinoides/138.p1 GENE.gnl/Ergobibamus_cyprinoides/138~~gnl/Ergobibamus_cyprinoides/138.p1  ORF type:complete len:179 (+),score=77.64 gnl/Ergobibamus_cyprinoides/138:488-1024(+)
MRPCAAAAEVLAYVSQHCPAAAISAVCPSIIEYLLAAFIFCSPFAPTRLVSVFADLARHLFLLAAEVADDPNAPVAPAVDFVNAAYVDRDFERAATYIASLADRYDADPLLLFALGSAPALSAAARTAVLTLLLGVCTSIHLDAVASLLSVDKETARELVSSLSDSVVVEDEMIFVAA